MKRSRLFSKSRDAVEGNIVQEAARAGEDLITCFANGIGSYCGCLSSSVMRWPRSRRSRVRLVEVGGELREGRELAVLREVEAQLAGDLLHRLGLRVTADAGDRDADVDRRAGYRR